MAPITYYAGTRMYPVTWLTTTVTNIIRAFSSVMIGHSLTKYTMKLTFTFGLTARWCRPLTFITSSLASSSSSPQCISSPTWTPSHLHTQNVEVAQEDLHSVQVDQISGKTLLTAALQLKGKNINQQ